MPYNEKTATRIGNALPGLLSAKQKVAQIKMMGGLVFTVNGHMCCGVTGDDLMVRVGPDAYEESLAKEHVKPLDIGGGRQPRAFVCIEPAGFKTKPLLVRWIKKGVIFVSALPPKKKRAAKSK